MGDTPRDALESHPLGVWMLHCRCNWESALDTKLPGMYVHNMQHSEWTTAQTETRVSVDRHDLDVAYYDAGSGDTVVFLHGIPTWSYLWRDIAPTYRDTHRVIVPDLVGYGNSAMHDGFDRSIRAQEVMLTSLLAELDIGTVSIVGHDIGGGVGLRFASHNPDRVDKLVLSNATAYAAWPVRYVHELGLPAEIETTTLEELRETLAEAYRSTLYRDEPNEAFVEGMLAQYETEQAARSMGRNAIATNTNHTTEIEYGAITADTLLLWGENDNEQPISDAKRLREDIQDAEISGLSRANHWVTEDRPEAYRTELEAFLKD